MSIKVMTMVSDSGLQGNHKLVMHAYADRASDDGDSVFPGEKEVAWKTSYSIPTVRRITRELLEIGVMIRTKRGHSGQRAEYTIDLEWLVRSHSEREAYQDDTLSENDEKAYHLTRESLSPDDESLSPDARKPITGDTPYVSDPSDTSVIRQLAARPRDELWDTLVNLFGEPATKSERGKYNKIRRMFNDADVTPEELPNLVAAFMSKHSKQGRPGPQPTAMTIAQRIGELRHFNRNGPMMSPNGSADRIAEDAAHTRAFNELREEFPDQALTGGN